MTHEDLAGLDDLLEFCSTAPLTVHNPSVDELNLALANPVDWLRTNLMRRHLEVRDRLEASDVDQMVGLASGNIPVDMSDERNAIWHARMPKILAVLKRVAQYTPVPYNFAVILIIVILIIIDENRLTPKELAAMLARH